MRTVLIILFLLALPFGVSRANNYETLDQSFEFKTGGTVKIDNGLGDVKIEVWAEELVHVTAKKIEPAGRAVALSDIAFFNTKTQLTIKSKPAEQNGRIDLIVYVPRNTNVRINTTTGAVTIRGAIQSALVETKSGAIKLESPPSQDADVVMTSTVGTVKSALPLDTYAPPTPKSVQGKMGSGGNPIILRTTDGNIQIAALERELDKDVATIPSAPPPSSSSDQRTSYSGYGNNDNYGVGGNSDSLYGGQPDRSRPRNNQPSQPYTLGGYYGGRSGNTPGNNSGNNRGNNNAGNQGSQGSQGNQGSSDIFGGRSDTDTDGSLRDYGNLGVGGTKGNSNNDTGGGVGVRIIPPPGSARRDNNPDTRDTYQDQQNGPGSSGPTPPPLRRRPKTNTDDNNSDVNQNNRPQNDQPSDEPDQDQDQIAANRPNDVPSVTRRNSPPQNQPPTVLRNKNSNEPSRPQQASASDDDAGGEVIKVDTKLVTLNVSVMDRGGRAITNLKDRNFQVFEDGVQQTISHFESVNTPFNLVLLVDLSGSIIDKIDILRRAMLRFIDTVKPEDKVAIVCFTRTIQVVCELTNDRQLLRQRLQYMHLPKGGTALYESMWFTLDQIIEPVKDQRNAIVLLSDGVDNSISVTYPIPSRVTYEQVIRKAQESNALVFPIYLDTEEENVSQDIEKPESYVLARKQLTALAETTGGVYIRAERPENLEGVYEKIAADLRTLYSIAYYPTNSSRDGSWRKLKVKVDKGDVAVRTRRGYYAK